MQACRKFFKMCKHMRWNKNFSISIESWITPEFILDKNWTKLWKFLSQKTNLWNSQNHCYPQDISLPCIELHLQLKPYKPDSYQIEPFLLLQTKQKLPRKLKSSFFLKQWRTESFKSISIDFIHFFLSNQKRIGKIYTIRDLSQ